jgi:hypothetical protein
VKRDERFRIQARELYHEDGQIEVDDDARISVADGGAYVEAWVWVPLKKQQSRLRSLPNRRRGGPADSVGISR